MKKVLFIDRDGTMIVEPPPTYQIDSFEKLEFIPGMITAMNKIALTMNFELAMVTNQDGLGSESFPENTFWPVQSFIIKILEGEGVKFDEVFIDKSKEEDKAPTRKPGIAMLKNYFSPAYDLRNSFVIGDRLTDIMMATNLGCKALLLRNQYNASVVVPLELKDYVALETDKWSDIHRFLLRSDRAINHIRKTNETTISISLNLDGAGNSKINTGLGFFDHMIDQIARHSGVDLEIQVNGDLHIDEHHTIEDTGIALGEAFNQALGKKAGIERYGFSLPMDDCLAQVALDFGGRSYLVWDVKFSRERVGDVPTEMFSHFFKSFTDGARCNLNMKAEGENEHHKIESIFKAFSRSIRMAIKRNEGDSTIPSTKGNL